MAQDISHQGRIISITPEITKVEIISKSACASCSVAGLCSAAEATKKEIEVPTDPNGGFEVGQLVEVCLKQSMGTKAVWISYVIPVAILLILVVSLSDTEIGELYAGLIGIGGVGLYYFIIYLLRDKIAKDYVFYIKGL